MALSVVIGVAITAAAIVIVSRFMDKEENGPFRQFALFLVLPLLFLIPGSLVLEQDVCEVVLNYSDNAHVYGNNFTYANGSFTYHFDYGDPPTFLPADDIVFLFHERTEYQYTDYCYTSPNASPVFLRVYGVVVGLFFLYVLVWFVGWLYKTLLKAVRKI